MIDNYPTIMASKFKTLPHVHLTYELYSHRFTVSFVLSNETLQREKIHSGLILLLNTIGHSRNPQIIIKRSNSSIISIRYTQTIKLRSRLKITNGCSGLTLLLSGLLRFNSTTKAGLPESKSSLCSLCLACFLCIYLPVNVRLPSFFDMRPLQTIRVRLVRCAQVFSKYRLFICHPLTIAAIIGYWMVIRPPVLNLLEHAVMIW